MLNLRTCRKRVLNEKIWDFALLSSLDVRVTVRVCV